MAKAKNWRPDHPDSYAVGIDGDEPKIPEPERPDDITVTMVQAAFNATLLKMADHLPSEQRPNPVEKIYAPAAAVRRESKRNRGGHLLSPERGKRTS